MDRIEEERRLKCPRCGSTNIVYDPDSGESVCGECGLVLEELVDRGPEWRAFTPEEREERRRTGAPGSYTYYDKGLSTRFEPREAEKNREKMWRLRRWDVRTKLDEAGMRNLRQAMAELDRISDKLHLPQSVREQAAVTYRRALQMDLIRGRSIDNFVAASVYAACRQARVPRSLQEIADATTRDLKDVSRTYRLLLRELDLRMPVDYPMKFVPKIASKVNVSQETDRLTVEILRKAREERALTGKDPLGMAAAALYMACKFNREGCTQKQVSEAAGTTEVTLRNRLKDLEEIVGDLEEFRSRIKP